MAKYVKCPRCDLNYILEGEDYCAVCKAELKIGPSLLYGDEDDLEEEKLCPHCKSVNIPISEEYCENCKDSLMYEPESSLDPDSDEKWRDYLDEDEKEEFSNSAETEEEMISLSQIKEEVGDEFGDDEEEEEDEEEYNEIDKDDDFNYDVTEEDFIDDEEDEDADEDEDDDF